jgi:hypothetical protein
MMLMCVVMVAFLLENGSLYHIAHAVAISEYLITVHFYPSLKTHTNVAFAGTIYLNAMGFAGLTFV